MQDPIRTLAVLYFSIFNNIRPQPYLILAFKKNQNRSQNFSNVNVLKKIKTPGVPYFCIFNRIKPQSTLFQYFQWKKTQLYLILAFSTI